LAALSLIEFIWTSETFMGRLGRLGA
jgi:hypothetical protein